MLAKLMDGEVLAERQKYMLSKVDRIYIENYYSGFTLNNE